MNAKAALVAVLLITFTACATSPDRTRQTTTESIRSGIAAALNASPLDSDTKSGCLRSLDFWREDLAYSAPSGKLTGGLFFLGDSYLVADFAYLDETGGLIWQAGDSTKRLRVLPSQIMELHDLLFAAHSDGPPKQPMRSTHTTCVVFLDPNGRYFPVEPDDSSESNRAVDKAIVLLERLVQGAP